MSLDTKEINRGVRAFQDEPQSPHPIQRYPEASPMPPEASPMLTTDHIRPIHDEVGTTNSAPDEIPLKDPLERQIQNVIVLANNNGDSDALRRAAILHAQYQAELYARSGSGLYDMDGTVSEESVPPIDRSESNLRASEEPASGLELQAGSGITAVSKKSSRNEGRRRISNVPNSLHEEMSQIPTAEPNDFPSDLSTEQHEPLGIWQYLSRLCCKIWGVRLFREDKTVDQRLQRLEAIDHNGSADQIANEAAIKSSNTQQNSREADRKSKRIERAVHEAEQRVMNAREQLQDAEVAMRQAKRAEKLQRLESRKTRRLARARRKGYNTNTMTGFNYIVRPAKFRSLPLLKKPSCSRKTTPDS